MITHTRIATALAATVLAAASLAPAYATTADPSSRKGEAASSARPPKPARYCVKQEAVTGSIFSTKKVCKSREEWIAETGRDPARK